jgi:hypothetical protein
MLAGNIIVQFFGCLFFFMRAYSRLAITKTWRTEDYILTAAWVSTLELLKVHRLMPW